MPFAGNSAETYLLQSSTTCKYVEWRIQGSRFWNAETSPRADAPMLQQRNRHLGRYRRVRRGHTVISDNVPPFDTLSPALNLTVPAAPNANGISRTFATVGHFGYHCGVHTGDPVPKMGMWGIIHVVAS
jgi:hypothetical protein